MGLISAIKTAGSKAVSFLANPTGKENAGVSNILPTLKAALTGEGVSANTGNKAVDKVLSAAASNPYTTAGIATAVVNPAAALGTAKSIATKVTATTTGKIAVGVGVPVVVAGVISAPKKTATTIATAPTGLSNFGGNLGTLINEPSVSNLKTLVSENPVISGSLAAAGVYITGKGISSAATSVANTLAVQKSTAVAEKILQTEIAKESPLNTNLLTGAVSELPLTTSKNISSVPITPSTQIVGKAASSSVAKRRKTPLRKMAGALQRQTLRVNIFNNTKSLYRRSAIYY